MSHRFPRDRRHRPATGRARRLRRHRRPRRAGVLGRLRDGERERLRASFVFERFVVAIDGDDLVGMAGSFDFELTLPGGATVPTAGTTWVSVAPTHRRRGITRDMLGWVHDDAVGTWARGRRADGERGSIYERFGYGARPDSGPSAIDRTAGALASRSGRFGPGRCASSTRRSSVDEMHERYDRYRRGRCR